VRRSAQDDVFVRGLEIQMVGICRKHEQIEKVTNSQDDVFVGGLEIQMVGYAENTNRSKKSQALEMIILFAW
jgi:hypothetical protein